MKALLDMPVSAALLDVLHAHGHEGVHAYYRGLDRASDSELLELARREEAGYLEKPKNDERIRITEDGELEAESDDEFGSAAKYKRG